MILGVPLTELDRVWPIVEPMLRASIEAGGTHDPEDVLALLKQNDRVFLYVERTVRGLVSCIITELLYFPKMRVCRVILAGSSGKAAWKEYYNFLELHCKEHDFSAIESIGRHGWKRICGGEIVGSVVRKVLS